MDIRSRLRFRPISEGDAFLLYRIYASTREGEMALMTHWTEEAKQAFLLQQFEAQHIYYHQNYHRADFDMILFDEAVAGRFYVHERPDEFRIVDITLLPEFRNLGIGTVILSDLLEKARISGKSVSIHVERNNPARLLYERLGFELTNDSHAIYILMTWRKT